MKTANKKISGKISTNHDDTFLKNISSKETHCNSHLIITRKLMSWQPVPVRGKHYSCSVEWIPLHVNCSHSRAVQFHSYSDHQLDEETSDRFVLKTINSDGPNRKYFGLPHNCIRFARVSLMQMGWLSPIRFDRLMSQSENEDTWQAYEIHLVDVGRGVKWLYLLTHE